jgi:hypothetical protein
MKKQRMTKADKEGKKVLKVYVTETLYKAMAHKGIDNDVSPEILVRDTLEAIFSPKKEKEHIKAVA